MQNTAPTVWVCFMEEGGGGQLEVFNSKAGPFPPEPGTKGHIAIGWPRVGDMVMHAGNYDDYAKKFGLVYPKYTRANTRAAAANIPWKFAFEMKIGDWVVSPCSAHDLILVGQVTGDYEADFANDLGLDPEKRRLDYVHVREVVWTHKIERIDSRFKELSGWGQLTLFKPSITVEKLKAILGETVPEAV